MCGIAGFIASHVTRTEDLADSLVNVLSSIAQRGPDCFGIVLWSRQDVNTPFQMIYSLKVDHNIDTAIQVAVREIAKLQPAFQMVCLANFRGIPTTEDYGITEDTIQPFITPRVTVVHNGLLTNDKQMKKENLWGNFVSADVPDIDSYVFARILSHNETRSLELLKQVEGSYAMAALDKDYSVLWLARNFRGLFLTTQGMNHDLWFASEAEALTKCSREVPWELPLDSAIRLYLNSRYILQSYARDYQRFLLPLKSVRKCESAVVVLSGGMDSTVCATWACENYQKVHFMHFQYGCRAEDRELTSFNAIVDFLTIKYSDKIDITRSVESLDFIKRLGGSTLTDTSLEVANGEKGVETDSEWVPARNVVMISLAAAYCDRNQFDSIILGLNMEEGSVFADNSIEFYRRMESALAIGAKSAPRLKMPLGNLMKRHILKLGLQLEAPLHLSWSCYHGGELRCGTCGPCIMRRHAFTANGIIDMVEYADKTGVETEDTGTN